MHEMSLCRNLLATLEQQRQANGFKKIKTVWLTIGPWATVEHDALRFGFEVASRNSIAHGATLVIETVPGRGWCAHCGADVAVQTLDAACPLCGHYQVVKAGGDELIVSRLEVE